MKNFLSLAAVFIFIGSYSVHAQNAKVSHKAAEKVYDKVEQMPEFPGGEQKLMEFIRLNMNYPSDAKKNGVTGKVYASFVVDKSGKVRDARILRGIGSGCDEEVLRIISLMPEWKPGMQDGQYVNVSYTLPVSFSTVDRR